jgi:hypothetical protein
MVVGILQCICVFPPTGPLAPSPTAGVTMASLSLNRAVVVAKYTLVQQGAHFLGANKKMHQLAVKTLPPIIHVKQHMVRCQSMAGASMPQSSPDESFPTATGRL